MQRTNLQKMNLNNKKHAFLACLSTSAETALYPGTAPSGSRQPGPERPVDGVVVVGPIVKVHLIKARIGQLEQQFKLPIVLSGVEAPYMQRWLKARGVDAKLLEDRSMNTCENSRFSSLLLQKKGGAPRVILITDQYHMPRTRRLFALNGIETQPIEAPMPTQLTQWRPSEQNYDHSRRANYEMLATIRDVLLGSSDCREIP